MPLLVCLAFIIQVTQIWAEDVKPKDPKVEKSPTPTAQAPTAQPQTSQTSNSVSTWEASLPVAKFVGEAKSDKAKDAANATGQGNQANTSMSQSGTNGSSKAAMLLAPSAANGTVTARAPLRSDAFLAPDGARRKALKKAVPTSKPPQRPPEPRQDEIVLPPNSNPPTKSEMKILDVSGAAREVPPKHQSAKEVPVAQEKPQMQNIPTHEPEHTLATQTRTANLSQEMVKPKPESPKTPDSSHPGLVPEISKVNPTKGLVRADSPPVTAGAGGPKAALPSSSAQVPLQQAHISPPQKPETAPHKGPEWHTWHIWRIWPQLGGFEKLLAGITFMSMLKACCMAGNILVQLSPYPQVTRWESTGCTGDSDAAPYVSIAFGGWQWCYYGLFAFFVTKRSGFLILVHSNCLGAVLGTYYSVAFYRNCNHDHSLGGLQRYTSAVVMLVLFQLCSLAVLPVERALFVTGLISSFCSFIGAISILVSLPRVIQTQDSTSIPALLVSANLVSSLVWCICGWMLEDPLIASPNIVGFLSGCVCMSLKYMYPAHEWSSPKREQRAPTAIATVADTPLTPSRGRRNLQTRSTAATWKPATAMTYRSCDTGGTD